MMLSLLCRQRETDLLISIIMYTKSKRVKPDCFILPLIAVYSSLGKQITPKSIFAFQSFSPYSVKINFCSGFEKNNRQVYL